MVEVKEGDRVQYVIELGSESIREGVVQKVLRGGESLAEEYPSSQSKPRYVRLLSFLGM